MSLAAETSHVRHIVVVLGSASADTDEAVKALLAAGFDAVAVESGAAMLALLETGFQPCVLVLDVDVPDMDAWELWSRVKVETGRDRPAAVLLSDDRIDAARARGAAIGEFFRKPVAYDRLITAVERHCPRRVAVRTIEVDDPS